MYYFYRLHRVKTGRLTWSVGGVRLNRNASEENNNNNENEKKKKKPNYAYVNIRKNQRGLIAANLIGCQRDVIPTSRYRARDEPDLGVRRL